MIRKRSIQNISSLKRQKLSSTIDVCDKDIPTDTQSALTYLYSMFPVKNFQDRLPPIIMRHQIYSFVKCRTEVDKCLNEMKNKGEIRLFKLGHNDDDVAVVLMKDYINHIQKCCPANIIDIFLPVVKNCPDISYNKQYLIDHCKMKDKNISELIQHGVLTARDVGCYWLSIPNMGEFVKAFRYGRRIILLQIKRTKYKEILQFELEKRKWPQKALLGFTYHIHDIIGADLVKCVETSTGIVLRLAS